MVLNQRSSKGIFVVERKQYGEMFSKELYEGSWGAGQVKCSSLFRKSCVKGFKCHSFSMELRWYHGHSPLSNLALGLFLLVIG